jgi:hypothetical protein
VHIFQGINVGKIRWVEHVARNRENRNAYKISVLETERDRPLGRPRRRWNLTLKCMFYR